MGAMACTVCLKRKQSLEAIGQKLLRLVFVKILKGLSDMDFSGFIPL
jgi:hypothetical protein